ncbi:MAG: J domain-containing protein [Myxococcales bacterium]|nr:J domain-containing protein [Myxococcales bacterium]
MSLLGQVAGAARRVARTAADVAMAQPAVRRRVDRAREVYADARRVAEARFRDLEAEAWAWIRQAQEQAQRQGRQIERRRTAAQHYATLGLADGADMAAVKGAYRKMMRAHHPDKFAHDPQAEARAQAKAQLINEAYQELTALLTGRESRRADR